MYFTSIHYCVMNIIIFLSKYNHLLLYTICFIGVEVAYTLFCIADDVELRSVGESGDITFHTDVLVLKESFLVSAVQAIDDVI